jgi:hypothetical protein
MLESHRRTCYLICSTLFLAIKTLARASCANCTTYCVHRMPDLHTCTGYRSFIPVLPRTSRPAAPHATYDQYVHGPPQATSHGGTYTLSDMCYQVFGRDRDASHCHKMLKKLFTIQNPLKHISSRKSHPTFKVKLQISYKREGDDFHRDNLCFNGYTYSSFMCNMPAPKKYLDKGLSPLHAHCLFLMDQLKEKYHVCGMDSLYTSARFFCEAYAGEHKVLCHGMSRKSGRGLPKSVI